jgi:hypothetical protein
LFTGCGKKGPPLAPIVRIPDGVVSIRAERVGSDVYVTLTVPAQNIDKSKPAAVTHVDVYGVTATDRPASGQFLAQASRVAQFPVIPLLDDGSVKAAADGSAPVGASQNEAITIHDALTPEQLVPKPPVAPARTTRGTPPKRPAPRTELAPEETETVPSGPPAPQRFYMAIAFSDRGRPGPPGAVAGIPLTWLPPPPTVSATAEGDQVTVTWEPSGGALGFVLDEALPIEAPPFDDITAPVDKVALASDVPPGPTRYNVYRADPSGSDTATSAPLNVLRPAPLNPEPLDTLTFTEPAEFGQRQCYVVRAVRGARGAPVEGDASEPQCVMPDDTVPPAPPANLRATPSAGAITLIWDPNTELDLAGYLVLRGEAGSATLQPLTTAPLVQPRYTDQTVVAGTRYVYAVVAIDDHKPEPNRSAESERVEETAR